MTPVQSVLCHLLTSFFLFLVRVKQGFPIEDLAVRFKVSPSTVSRVFLTWANFLYFMLGQIPIWPTKVQVKANLPDCFKLTYPNTVLFWTAQRLRYKPRVPKFLILNFILLIRATPLIKA